MDRCPNCGATVRPNAKFCTACGRRLLPKASGGAPSATMGTESGAATIAGGRPTAPEASVSTPPVIPADQRGPRPPLFRSTAFNQSETPVAPTESGHVTQSPALGPVAREPIPTARSWQESRWGTKPSWRTTVPPRHQEPAESHAGTAEERAASAAGADTTVSEPSETVADENGRDHEPAEHDVLAEAAVVDRESDAVTDFPSPPSEASDVRADAIAAPVETTDAAWSGVDRGAEPEPSPAIAGPASVMPNEADEQMHDWDTASSEATETELTWFNDLDEPLAVPEAPSANTLSAGMTVRGQGATSEDYGEGETTSGETGADESRQWEVAHPAESAPDAAPAEMSAPATVEGEPFVAGSPVARAEELLTELRSLVPVIAGYRATVAEAFRSAGVDPDELLQRIDALREQTDTAAIQKVASVAAHAEGHEQDVRELEALMEQRAVIAELAQAVLEQRLILEELAAVLRAARER